MFDKSIAYISRGVIIYGLFIFLKQKKACPEGRRDRILFIGRCRKKRVVILLYLFILDVEFLVESVMQVVDVIML